MKSFRTAVCGVLLSLSFASLGKVVEIKNRKIIQQLKKQVELELESAYLYEARAHYSQNQGLKGAASWFKSRLKKKGSMLIESWSILEMLI